MPAVAPVVTLPEASILATVASLVVHTPPVVLLLNVVVELTHNVVVPVIVPPDAEGLIVIDAVAVAVPQSVTV